MEYPTHMAGSPLLPWFTLPLYIIFLISATAGTWSILHTWYWHVSIRVRMLRFVLCLVGVHLFLAVIVVCAAVYLLLPQPRVAAVVPENGILTSPDQQIEISFTRPVVRKQLSLSLSPDIPGTWVFTDPVYATHLFRKAVFIPHHTYIPGQKYTVHLVDMQNFLQFSPAVSSSIALHAAASPGVQAVRLRNGLKGSTDSIHVALAQPNLFDSEYHFTLLPKMPFSVSYDAGSMEFVLTADKGVRLLGDYILHIKKTDIVTNTETKHIVSRLPTVNAYYGNVMAANVLGLSHFAPAEGYVRTDIPVAVTFTEPMEKASVEKLFSIQPTIEGKFFWLDEKTLSFKPVQWAYGTTYTVTIGKEAQTLAGTAMGEDIVKTFTTIGTVKVVDTFPKDTWAGVAADTKLSIRFDQAVDHDSAESHIRIDPPAQVTAKWDGDELTLLLQRELSFSTTYTVTVAAGVKSVRGLDSAADFTFSFTTQDAVRKLSVPALRQQYALSCEIAALRMALAYRGQDVSEDTLLSELGTDPTVHRGDTWGNPHVAFVGNVRGKQMVNGYGVYWQPIARIAKKYREAQSFEQWTIAQLTETLEKGNPVVAWVYIKNGSPIHWYTPERDKIDAVPDEHAVTVVGFVGSARNPSEIIVNDPLSGQVYWSRETFEKKWNVFGRSGVVVF